MSHSTTPDNGGSSNLETLSLPSSPEYSSDGTKSVWPQETYWKESDNWLYRHKLAMMWMERDKRAVKGNNITLYIYLFF
jgi:hypothetical protein